MELVSVIIPCFNVEEYIVECLDSVLKQSYTSIEIICVDNNSTDNTWVILKDYQKSGKISSYKELKKGASAARNCGLEHAKGVWIQFLDADDLLMPFKIEHQIKLIEDDTCFLVGNSIKRKVTGEEVLCSFNQDKFMGLLQTNLGNTCANLWSKKALDSIGGWDENQTSSQEYNLMFNLLKLNENIVFDDQALTVIRERKEGQISQSDPEKKWQNYLDLRLRIIAYLQEREEYYKQNEERIQQILFDILRIYAKYNLKDANNVYKKNLLGYVPVVSSTTSEKYINLFRLFGFKMTEKIKRIVL